MIKKALKNLPQAHRYSNGYRSIKRRVAIAAKVVIITLTGRSCIRYDATWTFIFTYHIPCLLVFLFVLQEIRLLSVGVTPAYMYHLRVLLNNLTSYCS